MAPCRYAQTMLNAEPCTVFSFTLDDRPGQLLALANRFREADITLRSLWVSENGDGTATMECVPERDPQFRDFAKSAEIQLGEDPGVYVTATDHGGDFIRILEMIAGASINLEALEASSLGGGVGWVIRAGEDGQEPLLAALA